MRPIDWTGLAICTLLVAATAMAVWAIGKRQT